MAMFGLRESRSMFEPVLHGLLATGVHILRRRFSERLPPDSGAVRRPLFRPSTGLLRRLLAPRGNSLPVPLPHAIRNLAALASSLRGNRGPRQARPRLPVNALRLEAPVIHPRLDMGLPQGLVG